MKTKYTKEINKILDSIEELEQKISSDKFNDEENFDELLSEVSSAVIALESIEEILERDAEVGEMKKAIEE